MNAAVGAACSQSVIDWKSAATDIYQGQKIKLKSLEEIFLWCKFETFEPMEVVVGGAQAQDQGKRKRSHPQKKTDWETRDQREGSAVNGIGCYRKTALGQIPSTA